VSGQFHAPAALAPGERARHTHWIRDQMGPKASLDALGKIKIACVCQELNCSPNWRDSRWNNHILSYRVLPTAHKGTTRYGTSGLYLLICQLVQWSWLSLIEPLCNCHEWPHVTTDSSERSGCGAARTHSCGRPVSSHWAHESATLRNEMMLLMSECVAATARCSLAPCTRYTC
jgi:hypothetical protein